MNRNNLEIQTKYINQKNTFTGKEINLTSRVYFLSTNFNSYPARFKE